MKLAILAATSSLLVAAADLPVGGFSHLGLRVTDLDRARTFYTQILGFDQAFEQKNDAGKVTGAVIKINDDQFLELAAGPAAADRFTHLAFLSDRLEPLRSAIESLGLNPPQLRTGRDGTRNFSIQDPDHHRIEFVRYDPDSLQAKARGQFATGRRISQHMSCVAFPVSDRAAAIAFFHDRLAFVNDGGLLHPAAAPNDRIELLAAGAPMQFYLDVPDVAAAVSRLQIRGYKPADLADPDGTRIILKRAERPSAKSWPVHPPRAASQPSVN